MDGRSSQAAAGAQAGSPATVSLDEVRHVAALANLELSAEELPGMQRNLNAILEYIAQMGELDTTEIPAMAQPGELLDGSAAAPFGEALRTDQLRPSVHRDAVMAEAPETDGRFFKVPKVIER